MLCTMVTAIQISIFLHFCGPKVHGDDGDNSSCRGGPDMMFMLMMAIGC